MAARDGLWAPAAPRPGEGGRAYNRTDMTYVLDDFDADPDLPAGVSPELDEHLLAG